MQNDAFERLAQVRSRENVYFLSYMQICEKRGVACHGSYVKLSLVKVVRKVSCNVYPDLMTV